MSDPLGEMIHKNKIENKYVVGLKIFQKTKP